MEGRRDVAVDTMYEGPRQAAARAGDAVNELEEAEAPAGGGGRAVEGRGGRENAYPLKQGPCSIPCSPSPA